MSSLTDSNKPNKLFISLAALIIILLIGLIDYLTGDEMEFSVFYLLPIILLTWYGGSIVGLIAAVISAVVYYVVDAVAGRTYSQQYISYWNSAVPLAIFLIVSSLVTAWKRARMQGKVLSLTDNLTGAIDTRSFSELSSKEIERARANRQPLSVAYLDLDNLKSVNDSLGKSVGDRVLSSVVKQAKRELRKVDTVARLGGDEFAILMPVTDQEDAREAISRVQNCLLKEMKKHKWPITFTIVVLTCLKIPQTSDELIKRLEDLMVAAKKGGKNSVSYTMYGEEQPAPAPVVLPATESEAHPAPEAEAPEQSGL
jgi:diguanylate cyclase (GGDEF)-like protein